MCNCNKSSSSKSATPKIASSSTHFVSPIKRRQKAQALVASINADESTEELSMENISGETLADKCQTFAYVLGLEQPVPENVLIAAIEDPVYARNLIQNRDRPYLYELLNNPPESLSGTRKANNSFSNRALIAKAGKALLNWGLSGFPTVSKATLRKREDACLTCPNLIDSSTVLQKITSSSKTGSEIGNRTGNKACAVCGCVIKNKIRLATETCPVEVAETLGINRWGESILPK